MNTTQQIFKYVLFAVLLYLFALIISPFFTAIAFAAFFAAAFSPLNEKLAKKINKSISSLITVIATVVIILIPLGLFVGLVAKEAITFIAAIDTDALLELLEKYSAVEIMGYKINPTEMEAALQQWLSTAGKTI